MTLAKGLGSGLPIGMMVAKKALMEQWQRGAHGNTYGGNPRVLRGGARDARSGVVGVLRERRARRRVLHRPAARAARQVRLHRRRARQGPDARHGAGRGPHDESAGVEAHREADPAGYQNGMLLLSCGQSTIRFMPPLMVTKEHVDEAIAILDASLGETLTA